MFGFGLIRTWRELNAKGIMGINRRNADYVLKYNKRSLYPLVDDKILTKERAIEAGINVPEMYGVISTEKEIDKQLTEHFAQNPILTRQDFQFLCMQVKSTACRILRKLVEEGKLKNISTPRNPVYVPDNGHYVPVVAEV